MWSHKIVMDSDGNGKSQGPACSGLAGWCLLWIRFQRGPAMCAWLAGRAQRAGGLPEGAVDLQLEVTARPLMLLP